MNKNALLILGIINGSDGHPTAEEIYQQARRGGARLSIATVYNNLAALCEQGLICKVATPGRSDRFDRATKHDHLMCPRCGALKDVTLRDLTDTIADQVDSPIDSYDLRVYRLCDDCRAQEEQVQA